jgi:hypothetical protein
LWRCVIPALESELIRGVKASGAGFQQFIASRWLPAHGSIARFNLRDNPVAIVFGRQQDLPAGRFAQPNHEPCNMICVTGIPDVSRIDIKLHLFPYKKVAVQCDVAKPTRQCRGVAAITGGEYRLGMIWQRDLFAADLQRQARSPLQQKPPYLFPLGKRRVQDIDIPERTILLKGRRYSGPIGHPKIEAPG